MLHSKVLQELSNFNIIVNPELCVESVSNNILNSELGSNFFNKQISNIFSVKIMFDDLLDIITDQNSFECNINELTKQVFNGEEVHKRKIVKKLSVNDIEFNYSFFITATLLRGVIEGVDRKAVSILIQDFMKFDSTQEYYRTHFDEFEEKFNLLEKMNLIGKFVIDFTKSKYKVYGNKAIPELLDLKKTDDNFYTLNSRHNKIDVENSIIKSLPFFKRVDKILSGSESHLTDEWNIKDKWLRLDAKVLHKDKLGNPKVLGGIIYDVTDYHKYKDLENVHSVYELAMASGGIGMFHYNLDKHDSSVFEANEIYANLFGLDPDENGMYKTEDFLKAQMSLEESISKYDEVNTQLNKIITGKSVGTTDDILKIKDLKTGYIRYLSSSSKIDEYFEDGKAKRLSGIVLDVTDRIIRERNQHEFAYKDELTSLGNNRLLSKNLLDYNDGIGLFFDLDHFKKINDTHGHLMGDKMIKLFGDSLSEVSKIYQDIYVYRLYGDEFFVFCENFDKSFAIEFEKKVKNLINVKMTSVKEDIILEASMGVAEFKMGSDIDDFIKSADYSMYSTKIAKKKRES